MVRAKDGTAKTDGRHRKVDGPNDRGTGGRSSRKAGRTKQRQQEGAWATMNDKKFG